MCIESNIVESKTELPVIALTGASGFVGSCLLQLLLKAGFRVRALQHSSALTPHKNLEVIQGGLLDADALDQLVQGVDCVIHCGGIVAARRKKHFFQINVNGTKHIVRAAQHANITKFLYISSLSTRQPDISTYARSKYEGELVVQQSKLQAWDIIRPPAVYGPGDKNLLPLLKLLKQRVGLLLGGKEARVSVIYVEDLAQAIMQWVLSSKTHQTVYEIDDGTETGYSWGDLLENASKLMGIKPYYFTPPVFLKMLVGYIVKYSCLFIGVTPFLTADKIRELSYPDWVCNNRRFEQDVNWKAKVKFQAGILKTLSWCNETGLLTNTVSEDNT